MEMGTDAAIIIVKTSVLAFILIRNTCFYIKSDKKTSEVMNRGTFVYIFIAKRIRFQSNSTM